VSSALHCGTRTLNGYRRIEVKHSPHFGQEPSLVGFAFPAFAEKRRLVD
jgi:hypothetical protein